MFAFVVFVALAAPQPGGPAEGAPYRRSDIVYGVTLGLGGAQLVDNALSGAIGFPFEARFTSSTGEALVFLTRVGLTFLDPGPLTLTLFHGVVVVAQAFRVFLPGAPDPLGGFYDRWADGSNRLGVRSGAMGRVSQGLQVGFYAAAWASLITSVADGIEHGFTWRRPRVTRPEPALVPSVQPLPGGAVFLVSFSR